MFTRSGLEYVRRIRKSGSAKVPCLRAGLISVQKGDVSLAGMFLTLLEYDILQDINVFYLFLTVVKEPYINLVAGFTHLAFLGSSN